MPGRNDRKCQQSCQSTGAPTKTGETEKRAYNRRTMEDNTYIHSIVIHIRMDNIREYCVSVQFRIDNNREHCISIHLRMC